MIDIKIKPQIDNYLRTFIPETAKAIQQVFQLLEQKQFNEADSLWHRLFPINFDLADPVFNLIRGVIWCRIPEKREIGRELLWDVLTNDPMSFTKNFHWLLSVYQDEKYTSEDRLDNCRKFIQSKAEQLGNKNLLVLALHSSLAMMELDLETELEYLYQMLELEPHQSDKYWIYVKAVTSIALFQTWNYFDFLKKAYQSFPGEKMFYLAFLKANIYLKRYKTTSTLILQGEKNCLFYHLEEFELVTCGFSLLQLGMAKEATKIFSFISSQQSVIHPALIKAGLNLCYLFQNFEKGSDYDQGLLVKDIDDSKREFNHSDLDHETKAVIETLLGKLKATCLQIDETADSILEL